MLVTLFFYLLMPKIRKCIHSHFLKIPRVCANIDAWKGSILNWSLTDSIVLSLSKRMRLFPNFSFDLTEAQKKILQKHYTPTLKYNHINTSRDFLLINAIRCCIALINKNPVPRIVLKIDIESLNQPFHI